MHLLHCVVVLSLCVAYISSSIRAEKAYRIRSAVNNSLCMEFNPTSKVLFAASCQPVAIAPQCFRYNAVDRQVISLASHSCVDIKMNGDLSTSPCSSISSSQYFELRPSGEINCGSAATAGCIELGADQKELTIADTCKGEKSQKFELEEVETRTFEIRKAGRTEADDLLCASTSSDSDTLRFSNCSFGSSNSQIFVSEARNGHLMSFEDGRCMHINDHGRAHITQCDVQSSSQVTLSKDNNNALVPAEEGTHFDGHCLEYFPILSLAKMAKCSPQSVAQQFFSLPVPYFRYHVHHSYLPNKCLEWNPSTSDIHLADCEQGNMRQVFHYHAQDGTIRAAYDSSCLDIRWQDVRLMFSSCTASASQVFRLTERGYVTSNFNGYCVDIDWEQNRVVAKSNCGATQSLMPLFGFSPERFIAVEWAAHNGTSPLCEDVHVGSCGTMRLCAHSSAMLEHMSSAVECVEQDKHLKVAMAPSLLELPAQLDLEVVSITGAKRLTVSSDAFNSGWNLKVKDDALKGSKLRKISLKQVNGLRRQEKIRLPSSIEEIEIECMTMDGTPFSLVESSTPLKSITFSQVDQSTFPAGILDWIHDTAAFERLNITNRLVSTMDFRMSFGQVEKLRELIDLNKFSLSGYKTSANLASACGADERSMSVPYEETSINICVLSDGGSSNETDSSSVTLIVIIAVVVVVAVAVCIAVYWYFKTRRNKDKLTRSTSHTTKVESSYIEYISEENRDLLPVSEIKIIKRLAQGRLGDVLQASFLEDTVVLKKQGIVVGEEPKGFFDEFICLRELNHPNIVHFYGVCALQPMHIDKSEYALMYDFMPKGDLRELLRNMRDKRKTTVENSTNKILLGGSGRDSLSNLITREANRSFMQEQITQEIIETSFTWQNLKISVALDILSALMYCHGFEKAKAHGNLKSSNVFLNDSLEAKITDFSKHGGTTSQRFYGSNAVKDVFWTAPEVFLGDQVDEKSDIYSFGIILSELITHNDPYHNARDSFGRLLQPQQIPDLVVRSELRPFVSSVPFDVSPPPTIILQLYKQCVHQDPTHRPSSKDVMHILANCRTGAQHNAASRVEGEKALL